MKTNIDNIAAFIEKITFFVNSCKIPVKFKFNHAKMLFLRQFFNLQFLKFSCSFQIFENAKKESSLKFPEKSSVSTIPTPASFCRSWNFLLDVEVDFLK
jgi:hypothetical protein